MLFRPLAFTMFVSVPVIFALPRKLSMITRQFLAHGFSTGSTV